MEKFLVALGITTAGNQAAVLEGLTAFAGVAITAGITAWIATATWKKTAQQERERRQAESDDAKKRADELRQSDESDLRRALRAEIFELWQAFYLFGPLDKRLAELPAKFRESKYLPFVTSGAASLLGPAIDRHLLLLDADEVQPVVALYRLIRAYEAFSSDLRSAAYAALVPGRKQAMLGHFLEMENELRIRAERCLNVLEPKVGTADENRWVQRKAELDALYFSNRETARARPVAEPVPSRPSAARRP